MIESTSLTIDFKNYALNLDIDIKDKSWHLHDGLREKIIKAISAVIEHFKLGQNFLNIEVYISLSNNSEIKDLNLKYRNKDKTTNVLSFPSGEINLNNSPKIKNINEFLHLGDIMLSYEVVCQESSDQSKTFDEHLSHLVVHSMLHLLGFDHEQRKEAEAMEKIEIDILLSLGIKSPYEY